jgi:hypothetical protein
MQTFERFFQVSIFTWSITLRIARSILRWSNEMYSSIGIHMRTLRAILNDARRIGIIKESAYPFGRDKYEVKASEGRKMALTPEQIGQFVRYNALVYRIICYFYTR